MNPLANTSIMLSLEVRKWGGEVSDKSALAVVAASFNSDTHNDKYKKSLFASDVLAPINLIAGRIRNHFYYETVPWLDGGKGRLIPSRNFRDFSMGHKVLTGAFENAVNIFVTNYEDYKTEAKEKKGDMFIATEYPPTDTVRSKFDITLSALPFPSTSDIRLDGPSEVIDEVIATMNSSISRVTSVVSLELESRFKERLAMLVNTLRIGKRFSASLLTELDFIIDFALNLETAIPDKLATSMKFVKKEITKYSPEELRNSTSLQLEIIKICNKLLA